MSPALKHSWRCLTTQRYVCSSDFSGPCQPHCSVWPALAPSLLLVTCVLLWSDLYSALKASLRWLSLLPQSRKGSSATLLVSLVLETGSPLLVWLFCLCCLSIQDYRCKPPHPAALLWKPSSRHTSTVNCGSPVQFPCWSRNSKMRTDSHGHILGHISPRTARSGRIIETVTVED